VLLAGALWLLLVPIGAIFIRHQPEDYGLAPDGSVARAADGTPAPVVAEEHWRLEEARRTPLFWIAALGMAAIAMLATGLFFHMVSILEDAGLAAEAVGTVFVPVAATTAIVNLGSGVLVDRVAPRLLLAAALLLMAASLFMAPFLRGVPMAFGYGIVLGATMGLNRTVGSVIWATYFGRHHLGAITGLASFILVAGSALGPMPFGIARDLLGSYTLVVTGSALIPLLLALAALRIKRPVREQE
jgi:predicted MFS family arabinose efflux permease